MKYFAGFIGILLLASMASAFCLFDMFCLFEPGQPLITAAPKIYYCSAGDQAGYRFGFDTCLPRSEGSTICDLKTCTSKPIESKAKGNCGTKGNGNSDGGDSSSYLNVKCPELLITGMAYCDQRPYCELYVDGKLVKRSSDSGPFADVWWQSSYILSQYASKATLKCKSFLPETNSMAEYVFDEPDKNKIGTHLDKILQDLKSTGIEFSQDELGKLSSLMRDNPPAYSTVVAKNGLKYTFSFTSLSSFGGKYDIAIVGHLISDSETFDNPDDIIQRLIDAGYSVDDNAKAEIRGIKNSGEVDLLLHNKIFDIGLKGMAIWRTDGGKFVLRPYKNVAQSEQTVDIDCFANCSIGRLPDISLGQACFDNCAESKGPGWSCDIETCSCSRTENAGVNCSSGKWQLGTGLSCEDDCSTLNTPGTIFVCDKNCQCEPRITPIFVDNSPKFFNCTVGIPPGKNNYCGDDDCFKLDDSNYKYSCNRTACKCEINQSASIKYLNCSSGIFPDNTRTFCANDDCNTTYGSDWFCNYTTCNCSYKQPPTRVDLNCSSGIFPDNTRTFCANDDCNTTYGSDWFCNYTTCNCSYKMAIEITINAARGTVGQYSPLTVTVKNNGNEPTKAGSVVISVGGVPKEFPVQAIAAGASKTISTQTFCRTAASTQITASAFGASASTTGYCGLA